MNREEPGCLALLTLPESSLLRLSLLLRVLVQYFPLGTLRGPKVPQVAGSVPRPLDPHHRSPGPWP